MQSFIDELTDKLKKPLPGAEAQYQMAHVARRTYVPAPHDARLAGVLVLFYPVGNDWNLVFIERTSGNPNDRHSGQISFPGGQYDPNDGTLEQTALREAHEEIGVPPETVTLAGALTELYIPVSNFLVKPFVGYTTVTPHFQPQLSEVRSIVEAPVEHLRQPETRQVTDLQLADNITLRKVPYFNVENKIVWGATAMMLNELLELIK